MPAAVPWFMIVIALSSGCWQFKKMADDHELGKSFSSLVKSIDKYIDEISTLSALRPEDNVIPQAEPLMMIDEEVSELENRVAEMKLFIESERSALTDLENFIQPATIHNLMIRHFENNLPRHLPGDTVPSKTSKQAEDIHRVTKKENQLALVSLATHDEFEGIPTSTRLRCTLEEINSILTSIQNIMKLKQTENSKKKGSRKLMEIFLTENELNSIPVLKKSLGGKTKALIHTLRALGKLKASIKNGKTVYIVISSD